MTQPTSSPPVRGTPMRVITDTVTMKTPVNEGDDVFTVFEIETPPSGGFPPHTQTDDTEGFYVLEGTYTVLVGEREYTLGAGDFLRIPPGALHGYVNPGPTPARMLVIAFPGSTQAAFFHAVGDALERPVWEPDMARFLAIAPKHGITVPTADSP